MMVRYNWNQQRIRPPPPKARLLVNLRQRQDVRLDVGRTQPTGGGLAAETTKVVHPAIGLTKLGLRHSTSTGAPRTNIHKNPSEVSSPAADSSRT